MAAVATNNAQSCSRDDVDAQKATQPLDACRLPPQPRTGRNSGLPPTEQPYPERKTVLEQPNTAIHRPPKRSQTMCVAMNAGRKQTASILYIGHGIA